VNAGARILRGAAAPIGARLVAPIFHRLLDRIDRGLDAGAIEASLPDGSHRLLGGRAPGPLAVVEVRRWRALVRLARGGSVGWYEAWRDGDWWSADPVPLFDLFMRNRLTLGQAARASGLTRLLARFGHARRRNDRPGARRNIAAHYDVGNDFYAAWLDPGMTYSSAIFSDGDDLGAGQRRKLDAILDRAGVGAGTALLEIGCGWGSLAAAASARGATVDALTLSARQKAHVDAQALPGVAVHLTDYRDAAGAYDAIASIEMVEAVGQHYWPTYLDAIAKLLKPGGRAALQLITIADDVFPAYSAGVDFIQAHVFPGGMLVSESRFRALAESRGLEWCDPFRFGPDYAETLRLWRERFDLAARDGTLGNTADTAFQDLWRYYLRYCEGGFRGGGIDVMQVTLRKR